MGTILIQGTKCLTWVREEFGALIATVHAIYTMQTTNSSVDMHKDVEDGLCSLQTPTEDRHVLNEASAPVCQPFIGTLLKCLHHSSGPPPVTDCGSPSAPAMATVTSLSFQECMKRLMCQNFLTLELNSLECNE